MSQQTTGTSSGESHGLEEFGYKQGLERSIGSFASFAAGVSYISILTGTFQLFYFGYGTAGPSYLWSWPAVFVGQLMVALCFAELSSRYAVAGSLYNWTKRLASPTVAWAAGWTMLVASIVTLSAVVLAFQLTLPQIWSGFQFIGTADDATDYALNAVILGTVVVVFTTLVNAFGVKLMSRINSTGVFIELIAAVVIIVLLAVNVTRGPDVVLSNNGVGTDHPGGYFGAFLVAALASGYVMYGFDTASSLGEETKDPRRTAPRAVIRAVVASFVLGGLIILLGLMAVPDLSDPLLGSSAGGLQHLVLTTVGSGFGLPFLACVVVAVLVCSLAVHTATIRMMFAMARDNNLPAGEALSRISPKFKTPVLPAIVVGVLAVVILVVNVGQPQIFLVLTSLAVGMIYLAYLLVTVPLLVARLRGRWPVPMADGSKAPFTLGRWGLPVNILAVLWGVAMMANLLWPRAEVYNPTEPFHWYLQYGALLFIAISVGGGLLYYRLRLRHRSGVLASHSTGATPHA
ncbi:APC family permease [Kineococcus gynurae]|uniref:APC family permease n=1 Tax=Kineococcus gynurae TaxID=452979 RepID=A0ABV5LS06_9ACTN